MLDSEIEKTKNSSVVEIGFLVERRDETWLPEFEIVLNKDKTGHLFDSAAFVVSKEKEGVFPIVVCTCGHIACSGVYVRVVRDGEYTYWTEFYHGQADVENFPAEDRVESFTFADGRIAEPPLKFLAENYIKVANGIEEIITSSKSDHRQYYLDEVQRYREGKDMFRP